MTNEDSIASDLNLIEQSTRDMARSLERIAVALERQTEPSTVRSAVLAEVTSEMDRTEEGTDTPPMFEDYVYDAAIRLLRIVDPTNPSVTPRNR